MYKLGPLLASANLVNTRDGPCSHQWLKSIASVEQFMNMVTFLVHPHMYRAGSSALEYLKANSTTPDIATMWPSLFSNISVIVNRETIPHRDGGDLPEAFDLLLALGTYSTAQLDIEDFDLHLEYQPGTAVFLCANVLKHGVSNWIDGDRVCYAHFLKGKVLEYMHVEGPKWVNISDYEDFFTIEREFK